MSDENIPVGVTYRVHDDGASKAAQHIGGSLDHAGKASHGLRHRLGELRAEIGLTVPALLGVGYGLGAWVEKAKEANAEFGRTKRAVAATLSTVLDWDKGVSMVNRYQRSTKLATEVTEKLQDVHARYGSSLEELGNAYRTVAISGGSLKLNQAQLLKLTTEAAAASKLFGVSGEDAANRIGNALMGRLRPGGDAFNRALSNMLGSIKKVKGEKVFEVMSKQMEKFLPMADEASKGMGDSFRRIHHQVDLLFEKASAPLFREIASSLGLAAKEAERLGASGRPIVEEYADKLVEAFRELRKITAFLFDHWKQIAAVWVGMKAVNLGAGIAGGLGALAGGGAHGGKGAGSQAASAIPIIGAAAGFLGSAIYGQHEQKEGWRQEVDSLRSVVADYKVAKQMQGQGDSAWMMRALGAAGKDLGAAGITDQKALIERTSSIWAAAQQLGDKETMSRLGVTVDELRGLTDNLVRLSAMGKLVLAGGEEDKESADAKLKTTGRAPINIANATFKFDFEDTDPDRVFVRVSDELEKMGNRRTDSAIAPPDMR